MNWLKKLFSSKPKPKRYTVYWCNRVDVPGPVGIFPDGTEMNFGTCYLFPCSQTYEAHSSEQALAMHRSDNPGTTPTSIILWP